MTAKRCGLGTDMEGIIADLIAKTPSVIEKVGAKLPPDFLMQVFESVTNGLGRAARQIEAMPHG